MKTTTKWVISCYGVEGYFNVNNNMNAERMFLVPKKALTGRKQLVRIKQQLTFMKLKLQIQTVH